MSDIDTQAVQAGAPSEAAVQLQLNDILLAAQIIQLASARGAFKVEEFTQVGGLYDRMIGFLQSTGAIQPQTPPADAAPAQGN
jgi:hypothetical protein